MIWGKAPNKLVTGYKRDRKNKQNAAGSYAFLDALEALSGGIKLSEITAAIHLFRKMFSFIHSLKVSLIR